MNYSNIPTNSNDPDTDVSDIDIDDTATSGTNDDGSGYDSLDGSTLANT